MRLPHFTPRQLSAFVAVAAERSFAKAGDRLSLTASAVSQLISELESSVGFRLFDRTTRSVVLSPAGRDFLPSAQGVLKNIELTQITADDIRNRAAGVVRLAVPMIMASTALPAAIKAYAGIHPRVAIRIRDCQVDRLVDMVSNAEVDLAIGGSDQAIGDDVISHTFFDSRWVLWCAPGHRLASCKEVSWEQLRQSPLVVAGRDHERTVALTQASAENEESQNLPIDTVDNISTAFGLASVGLNATVAPTYVGTLARAFGLVSRPIVRPHVMRKVCVYHSGLRELSPAAEGFREHLIQWFGDCDDPITWGKQPRPVSSVGK